MKNQEGKNAKGKGMAKANVKTEDTSDERRSQRVKDRIKVKQSRRGQATVRPKRMSVTKTMTMTKPDVVKITS